MRRPRRSAVVAGSRPPATDWDSSGRYAGSPLRAAQRSAAEWRATLVRVTGDAPDGVRRDGLRLVIAPARDGCRKDFARRLGQTVLTRRGGGGPRHRRFCLRLTRDKGALPDGFAPLGQ